jgi:hypothetical protein
MEDILLVQKFNAALFKASDTARDPYLSALAPALAAVEANILAIPELKSYEGKLLNFMAAPNFGLDALLTNEFAQTLGEAHFLIMCQDKGIALQRIPEEKNKKTPDFAAAFGAESVFLEVKTLSVVSGATGIATAQMSSLEANIDIVAQIASGKRVAIGTSEAQPYGNKVERHQTVLGVSNTLLEKARGNIKADQFANPNTFLVLNLSVIPPLVTEPKTLRPAYPDDYLFPKAVTGELWMVAFGNQGMQVLGTPEFEGLPCVEGIFDKVGVLADPDFASVAGLIFMVHPLSGPAQLFGLFRSKDWSDWSDNNPDLVENLLRLTGNNWNDDGDRNGWQLS